MMQDNGHEKFVNTANGYLQKRKKEAMENHIFPQAKIVSARR